MPPRITRRSASRDLGSSPPQQQKERAPDSSAADRLSRARSSGLEVKSNAPPQGRTTRSGKRQGSEDSVGSVESNASSQDGSRRKTKRAATKSADLSVVVEDQEELEDEELYEEEVEDEEDEDNDVQPQLPAHSPSGISGMPGTSALKTHSQLELADLDTSIIVEELPELWKGTQKLMHLLARDSSLQAVETTVKELQTIGSKTGKKLRTVEGGFDLTKENYGSDDFIKVSYILQKLFGDSEPDEDSSRPDLMLQGANVAILIKSLLVLNPDNPNTPPVLQGLDDRFPSPFMSGFTNGRDVGFSRSSMIDDTFALALQLRKQTAIALLAAYKEKPDFDPEELLSEVYYLDDKHVRELAGFGAYTGPNANEILESQYQQIEEDFSSVRNCFLEDEAAIESGDLVNFDQLAQENPWSQFLADVVQWGRIRMEEIEFGIKQQGGAETIQDSLVEKMRELDSQIELDYIPPRPTYLPTRTSPQKPEQHENQAHPLKQARPGLQPSPDIIRAPGSRTSLLTFANVQKLRKSRNSDMQSSSAPKDQQQSRTSGDRLAAFAEPSDLAAPPRSQSALSEEEEDRPLIGADDDEEPELELYPGTVNRAVKLYGQSVREENKENTGGRSKVLQKKSFIDHQEGAQRVQFDSQDDEPPPRPRPSTKQQVHVIPDSDPEEEEEAFTSDKRQVDPAKRSKAPLPRSHPEQTREPASKRVRVEHSASSRPNREQTATQQERRDRERLDNDLQASAQEVDGSLERHEAPPGSYMEINDIAKQVTALHKIARPQSRQVWNVWDTELLIKAIGDVGCSWAGIIKQFGDQFDRVVDQGALKDKARNIKVDYLKAGTALPLRFDGVALGKKEIEKVRTTGMNPYRLEGEDVGDESHDMDGNPRY